MIKTATAAAILLLSVTPSAAEQDAANKSRTMLVHWECHAYAQQIGDMDRAKRHFDAGLRDGHIFFDAALADLVSDEQANSIVPVLVLGSLGGPNKDFMLGRQYEVITDYARDKYTRKADFGPERLEHDTDPELLRMKAKNKYDESNCDLLQ